MTTALLAGTEKPTGESMSASQLVESIGKLVAASNQPLPAVVHDVLRTIMKFPPAMAVSFFQPDKTLGFRPATPLICRKRVAHQAGDWEPVLTRLVMAVGRSGQARGELLADGKHEVAAALLGSPSAPQGILVVFMSPCQHEQLATVLVQLIAEKLSTGHSHDELARQTQSPFTDFVLSLDSEHLEQGFQQLANTLRRVCRVDMALVGISKGGERRGRLQAISRNRTFRRPSTKVSAADELLSECLLREEVRLVTRNAPDVTAAEAEFFRAFDISRCVLVPTRDSRGSPMGAIILAEGQAKQRPEALKQLASRHAPAMGQALMLIARSQPTWIGKLARQFKAVKSKKQILAIALAVLGTLLVPVPYRVTCDSELRPVMRRFVAAPYDGRLRDVLVQPGDIVAKGQVLARMDRREVDLQLASLRAQQMRARKHRDTSLALRERAETQISKLEIERLDAQIELLEARAGNLEIKAPIDGIVLAGDPKDLQGAGIELGQTLFETGPVDSMLAELWVEGEDIAHVAAGQTVRLRLDAHPHRVFRGEISSVGPRAEIRGGQSVFVATVLMQNEESLMRPGMAGRVKVSSGYAPLIWNVFHKPWEALTRLGW